MLLPRKGRPKCQPLDVATWRSLMTLTREGFQRVTLALLGAVNTP